MKARARRARATLRERRRDMRRHSPICNCEQCTGTVLVFAPITGYDLYMINRYGQRPGSVQPFAVPWEGWE